MDTYQILPVGDSAVSVCFGDVISEACNKRVHALNSALQKANIPGVIDLNPTYCSLLVTYNPLQISCREITGKIRAVLKNLSSDAAHESCVFLLPVCYGGVYGEDLSDVAAHTGLSEEEVIRRHSAPDYHIYMLGFLPGFSYLGGMDPALATPRLPQPRKSIPAGSVGIGGAQTGVYPLDSPGGWRLIGRTPVLPYNPASHSILYAAGDYIRFCPVSEEEYHSIEQQIAEGTYVCPRERRSPEA